MVRVKAHKRGQTTVKAYTRKGVRTKRKKSQMARAASIRSQKIRDARDKALAQREWRF